MLFAHFIVLIQLTNQVVMPYDELLPRMPNQVTFSSYFVYLNLHHENSTQFDYLLQQRRQILHSMPWHGGALRLHHRRKEDGEDELLDLRKDDDRNSKSSSSDQLPTGGLAAIDRKSNSNRIGFGGEGIDLTRKIQRGATRSSFPSTGGGEPDVILLSCVERRELQNTYMRSDQENIFIRDLHRRDLCQVHALYH